MAALTKSLPDRTSITSIEFCVLIPKYPLLTLGCTVWENDEPFKVHLSAIEISSTILERARDLPGSNVYTVAGVVFACVLATLPVLFKYKSIWLALQVLNGIVHSFGNGIN